MMDDKVDDIVANMEVDKVANMVAKMNVDMVADMVWRYRSVWGESHCTLVALRSMWQRELPEPKVPVPGLNPGPSGYGVKA